MEEPALCQVYSVSSVNAGRGSVSGGGEANGHFYYYFIIYYY